MRSIYIGDHTVLATTKLGAKIYVDSRDISIAPHLMMEGDWEPAVTNCMVTFLQRHKGCLFIDVGANVGWYTLLAAHFGAAHVCTFEPNPRLAELLRKTISVNGLRERVTLTEAACGAETTKARFIVDPSENGGGHTASATPQQALGAALDGAPQLCDVVRLDDAVKARHLSKGNKLTPIIMKVDVEGFEAHVLAGAPEIMVFEPILFIEHNDGDAEMIRGLQSKGYSIRHVQRTGHPSKVLTLDEAVLVPFADTLLCVPHGVDT